MTEANQVAQGCAGASREKYPALMDYITSRQGASWDQFRDDERDAVSGRLDSVANDLRRAQADYGSYPYNSAMKEFLGLDIEKDSRAYYMANQVKYNAALGQARRQVEQMIPERRPLKIVAARCKKTGKPVRTHTFIGPDQIMIEGASLSLQNGRVRVRLSYGFSLETIMVKAALAMKAGVPYGEEP
jgi:hypothetical protein